LHRISGVWTRVRLGWLTFWGWLANLAGYPCVVREGQYASEAHGVSVRVRASNIYTVITVNGVDVFFYRLSGRIDGVGINPFVDYTASRTLQSVDSVARSAARHREQTQSRKP
jgi:hypothetical protein